MLPSAPSRAGASFLFWQQYYDSPDGQTFCRFYLPSALGDSPSGLPLIAIVDPITGQMVKTWTGFKDTETLMDKLMDLADAPPVDLMDSAMAAQANGEPSPLRSAAVPAGPTHADPPRQPDFGTDAPASLAPSAGPTDEEIDALWGSPTEESPDGMQMRVKLPNGQNLTRRFLPNQTLHEVLVAVHATGHRLDPSKSYGLAAFGAAPAFGADKTLDSLGITRGAYNLVTEA